ncbi:UDP-glycosyltransferase 87A1-like [Impatiens glandulifera]|uniref:UDP-glycosyltransferase 87A1-like n=1 Tax=Impatiens glandulifera TaxID=253017 RepID=UPI001FB166E8|nr:UDP-glycosyltransferase 87A1-like [Impatiens glandulifera]
MFHLVAVPYPGRGHINPMMNLCKLILASPMITAANRSISITFVVTEEWRDLMGSDEICPESIRLETIPNVLPSEKVRTDDIPGFIDAAMNKMGEPVDRLLDRLDLPATAIIADTFLHWAVDIGNRRNIPVASLWTMSASVFAILHHFDLFVQNGHYPMDSSETTGDEQLATYIPGLAPIRLADLPTIFHLKGRNLLDKAIIGFSKVHRVQFLVFTSFFDLEPDVRSSLKSQFPFPVLSVGPLIPYRDLHHNNNNQIISPSPELQWLDSQPHSSVLYISLGSFLSVSPEQMDDIAAGIKESGVSFIWVARGESSRIRSYLGEDYRGGLVVEWCEQLRVLCHSSIGGFWSHCGWNSTMESIFAGVPMITFPLHMDQVPNSKLIVDDLKIGVRMNNNNKKKKKKNGYKEEEMVKSLMDENSGVRNKMVKREMITEIVKNFMDENNGERREMVIRANELKEMNRRAIGEGGSSQLDLEFFINAISI